MVKTLISTPDLRLSACVAEMHSAHTAPDAAFHGTGVSCAGASPVVWGSAARVRTVVPTFVFTAQVAEFAGVRSTDLPGLPPRGAPV